LFPQSGKFPELTVTFIGAIFTQLRSDGEVLRALSVETEGSCCIGEFWSTSERL
jgi:hypothetical protein